MPEKILVALGGNALIKAGEKGTLQEQIINLDETLSHVVELIQQGHQLVITHGNGPQVGHILIRVEEARGKAYDLPLDVCVAQSQGEIGYLIQQRLQNLMQTKKMSGGSRPSSRRWSSTQTIPECSPLPNRSVPFFPRNG